IAEILVVNALRRDEFVPGLDLVLLPTGVVEILIEDDHGSWLQPVFQPVKDIDGRRIKIAIDVQKGDWPWVFRSPVDDRRRDPAFVERNVGGDARQPAAARKRALAQIKARPSLR